MIVMSGLPRHQAHYAVTATHQAADTPRNGSRPSSSTACSPVTWPSRRPAPACRDCRGRGFGRAVPAMDSLPHNDFSARRRWAHAGAAIGTEHLLYGCVLTPLIRATPLVTEPRNPRPVLLAAAPGEQHTPPLLGAPVR
jgi:hypothetical protein